MTHEPFDLVIYHANCLDGFAAAWAARKHSPNAEFIPATYGDVPPDVAGKRVLIVDFSYPRDVLLSMRYRDHVNFDMAPLAADLVIFDHHKTAAEDLDGFTGAVFDMERSGCGITWDVLHPDEVRPALIDHVEDRDLWRFAILETRAFIAGLTAEPLDFDVWSEIAAPDGSRYRYTLRSGVAVRGFTRKTCESIASRAYGAALTYAATSAHHPGHTFTHVIEVLALNCPPEFISDTADILKPRAAGRAIVGWFFDGDNFVFSLRSADDGPDVSEIARAFGGGGHKHAAGFRWGHNLLVKS